MADTVTMPGARLTWRGAELAAAVRKEYELRMQLALEEIAGQVKRNISVPTRSEGPSKPGEPPHADTGMLRNSIFWTFDPATMTGIVGTPLLYGLYLEQGTSGGQVVYPSNGSVLSWVDPATGRRRFARWVRLGRIEPRPFLAPAVGQMVDKLRRRFEARLPDFAGGLRAA